MREAIKLPSPLLYKYCILFDYIRTPSHHQWSLNLRSMAGLKKSQIYFELLWWACDCAWVTSSYHCRNSIIYICAFVSYSRGCIFTQFSFSSLKLITLAREFISCKNMATCDHYNNVFSFNARQREKKSETEMAVQMNIYVYVTYFIYFVC